jgi:hypothetical protein
MTTCREQAASGTRGAGILTPSRGSGPPGALLRGLWRCSPLPARRARWSRPRSPVPRPRPHALLPRRLESERSGSLGSQPANKKGSNWIMCWPGARRAAHLRVSGRERASSCAPGEVATSAQCPGARGARCAQDSPGTRGAAPSRGDPWEGARAAAAGGTAHRAWRND